MRTIYIIDKLILENGQLQCKIGRNLQKAHFRQGDLDGACGAYSIAMCLNILGVFKADDLYSDENFDKRTVKGRMLKALHGHGLYQNGLKSEEIKEIIDSSYSTFVTCDIKENTEKGFRDHIRESLDANCPVIVGIDFDSKHGHWVVGVGYECDKDGNMQTIFTLDPSTDSPIYSYWNGVLSLQRIPRKKYGYVYSSHNTDNVNISEAIVIKRK